MEKKNIDWGNLGFGYVKTDYRYVSNYKDGKWDEGGSDHRCIWLPSVSVQVSFSMHRLFLRAMKAYTTEDGQYRYFPS